MADTPRNLGQTPGRPADAQDPAEHAHPGRRPVQAGSNPPAQTGPKPATGGEGAAGAGGPAGFGTGQ